MTFNLDGELKVVWLSEISFTVKGAENFFGTSPLIKLKKSFKQIGKMRRFECFMNFCLSMKLSGSKKVHNAHRLK